MVQPHMSRYWSIGSCIDSTNVLTYSPPQRLDGFANINFITYTSGRIDYSCCLAIYEFAYSVLFLVNWVFVATSVCCFVKNYELEYPLGFCLFYR